MSLKTLMGVAKPSVAIEPCGSNINAERQWATKGLMKGVPRSPKGPLHKVSRLMSYFDDSSITGQKSYRVEFVQWEQGTAGNTRWYRVYILSKPIQLGFLPQLNYPEEKPLNVASTLRMTVIKSKISEGADKSRSRGDRVKKVWTFLHHFMETTEEGAVELRS